MRRRMFVSLPPWAVARNVGWPEQARLAARVGYKGIDWPFGAGEKRRRRARRARCSPSSRSCRRSSTCRCATRSAPTTRRSTRSCRSSTRTPLLPGDRLQPLPVRARPDDAERPDRRTERWALVQRRLVGHLRRAREARDADGPRVPRPARVPHARAASAGAPRRLGAPPPPPPVPFVWTLRETLALCEASGPNIGVTLDAWHWYHSGGTVADIRAAKRVAHRARARLRRATDAAGAGAGRHAAGCPAKA